MQLNQLLKKRISALAERQQHLSLWCQLATCWAGAGLLGLALVLVQRFSQSYFSLAFPLVVVVACGLLAMVVLRGFRRQEPSPAHSRALAQQIEAQHPDLEGRLLTAVQQAPPPGGELNYLQERLLLETLRHSQQHDWTNAIPRQRLRLARLAHWLALALFGIVLVELRNEPRSQLLAGSASVSSITVSPGDTSIERGNSLVVLARFQGPLPPAVDLVLNGAESNRISLVKSLADPTFGGSVPEVASNFVYRINYGGRSTRAYTVTVFEHPRLERADLDLSFPAYTRQPPQHIENTRRLSAVEGSSVDVTLQLNKPVAVARLVPRGNRRPTVPLEISTNHPTARLSHFPLQQTQTYELQLVDSDGRTNKIPAQFVFDVLSNRPPELKLVSPRNDLRPSPLEEIAFQGTVWDDFGVEAYGLGYIMPGQPARFVQLGQTVPAKEKKSFQYLLRLEDLQVKPDELVSWFLWADDLGPDGGVRRTTGDLFFAEVRPFDEVFREGQGMEGQGQGGEQSGGNQTSRLADLQKQIISATWNLQRKQGAASVPVPLVPDNSNQAPPRRESQNVDRSTARVVAAGVSPAVEPGILPGGLQGVTLRLAGSDATPSNRHFVGQIAPADSTDSAPSGSFPPRLRGRRNSGAAPDTESDVEVVTEAQAEALAQAQASAERARDVHFMTLWNAATKQMNEALAALRSATNSDASLKDALAAEQAAYQTLLKLQEHEYQVTRQRNRNQGGGSGRQQQMQRLLEEMELTQSENRYENQRQAQSPQAAQHHEQLQIMNRLQDLARRQKDLNDRLKELQTALQEAKTAEEKAELQRRLKRLQEEEQQMLADVDELRQRMDRPDNQSRLADERQQLDQTRQDVQRAADAAAEGAASQALAAGTRAQRQLQEMRDQLRKESSSQFADDLRSMRGQARELAQKQQEIQQSLQAESSAEHKSLSAPADHKDLLEALNRQRELMTNLLDRATQVSQQAETSEPLLSSQLYDTVRKFSQDSSKDVQQNQEELLNRGFLSRSLLDQLKDDSEQDGPKLLDIASDMVRRDFLPQAAGAGQRVGARLDDLKRGVEHAAESVLGDDTEALRLAKQELDQVTDELQREMAGAPSGGQTNGPSATAQAGASLDTNNLAAAERGANPGQQNPSEPGSDQTGNNQTPGNKDSTAGRKGPASLSSADNPDSASPANADSERGSSQGSAAGQAQTPRAGGNRAAAPEGGLASTDGGNDVSAGGVGGGAWNFDRMLNDQSWRRLGPITGEGFVNWSDRLREVEEIVEMPDLRNDIATVRERARLLRHAYKNERKKPDWAVVRTQVMNPLAQVRDRIADELARRQSSDNLVPIDRDPVPIRYSDLVRHYYEELSKEK